MSYDYINDTLGEFVKTSPKYQEVEKLAVKLLLEVVNEDISYEMIDRGFETVRLTLIRLVAENGVLGFPFWLRDFLVGPYAEWKQWYLLHTTYLESSNESYRISLMERYPYIAEMVCDDSFKKACMSCLSKLSHKANNANE